MNSRNQDMEVMGGKHIATVIVPIWAANAIERMCMSDDSVKVHSIERYSVAMVFYSLRDPQFHIIQPNGPYGGQIELDSFCATLSWMDIPFIYQSGDVTGPSARLTLRFIQEDGNVRYGRMRGSILKQGMYYAKQQGSPFNSSKEAMNSHWTNLLEMMLMYQGPFIQKAVPGSNNIFFQYLFDDFNQFTNNHMILNHMASFINSFDHDFGGAFVWLIQKEIPSRVLWALQEQEDYALSQHLASSMMAYGLSIEKNHDEGIKMIDDAIELLESMRISLDQLDIKSILTLAERPNPYVLRYFLSLDEFDLDKDCSSSMLASLIYTDSIDKDDETFKFILNKVIEIRLSDKGE